ncbi:MAG: methyltransferase [marine bacterium B5-7]|nr:MAG: methyltransferase [marine bacterium B5-7]
MNTSDSKTQDVDVLAPDSKARFSSRVDNYVKYRPSYPSDIVDWLLKVTDLSVSAEVVDLGSGTGLLSKIFLERGFSVTAVEPNGPMREAGRNYLANYPSSHHQNGSAESTGLGDGCADIVVSGQAFHWFEPLAARQECQRILRSPGYAAMIWNERFLGGDFMNDYENLLLATAPEYRKITASHVNPVALDKFFDHADTTRHELFNNQYLNLTGLMGRVMSSSYAPEIGRDGHNELIQGLERLYEQYASDNGVVFEYRTVIIFGLLKP